MPTSIELESETLTTEGVVEGLQMLSAPVGWWTVTVTPADGRFEIAAVVDRPAHDRDLTRSARASRCSSSWPGLGPDAMSARHRPKPRRPRRRRRPRRWPCR